MGGNQEFGFGYITLNLNTQRPKLSLDAHFKSGAEKRSGECLKGRGWPQGAGGEKEEKSRE